MALSGTVSRRVTATWETTQRPPRGAAAVLVCRMWGWLQRRERAGLGTRLVSGWRRVLIRTRPQGAITPLAAYPTSTMFKIRHHTRSRSSMLERFGNRDVG